jgi:hypothetical protein
LKFEDPTLRPGVANLEIQTGAVGIEAGVALSTDADRRQSVPLSQTTLRADNPTPNAEPNYAGRGRTCKDEHPSEAPESQALFTRRWTPLDSIFSDGVSRRVILSIAQSYELLAQRAEDVANQSDKTARED